ncbi:type II CAAX prenyl endopeptidase Rce1 family protein [Paenibacillus chartarius]|uniref:Type II CAAX prenyl endopeptidase Rce1 family protein n=1 Tax=Paenibacillus chartarius TaxID=747481 RepID=A0ABV6DS97_9BACL
MNVKRSKTRRNVILFSLVVLSCGWIGRLVDMQVGTDANGSLGQLIWIVSPLLCMVILRSGMGDGWHDFGMKPRFKGNSVPYWISLLFFPLMAVLIVGIGLGLGWTDLLQSPAAFAAAFGMAVVPSFVKNIFEEFAWRGYLAPKLFMLGYPRLLVHITVGLIWGAWHFPYLFVFVDTAESMITYIPRLMIGMIAMAVLYGEVRFISGSVWPAVIMHTMGNAFIDTLILQKFIAVHEEASYAAMPSPEGILAIAVTGLAGLWMWKKAGPGKTSSSLQL